ncbi:MAG: alpha/beta hydrolase, partial [Candidatus Obscuribacter sp.]|nr:alpha/beta hydrolase [Candidatus Obscuribacter sp.]
RYPALVDGLVSAVPSSDRFGKVRGEVVVGAHYLEDRDREIDISPTVVARSTSDKTMQREMKDNPTNRMKISPRELKAFEDFMKGNNDAAALIEKQPVLMMAGFKDKLVKPEGTIELFNALTTQDKLLMVVGDGEHLLLEENQMTSQMAQLLDDWIRSEGASLRRR